MNKIEKVMQGNNLDVLKKFPDNFFDSVVTDPPYGISFMGKKWDYDVPTVETWKEVLRVLKPGGHMLVACGTRTQHRMAVNIEDAGFEVRDIVAWVYGSGFPKNHDISKAIDRTLGAEREVLGISPSSRPNNDFSNPSFKIDNRNIKITKPKTEEAKQWQGWGTGLKPSMELWTMARKPIEEPNIAKNVIKYGTGGINIDGCRVEGEPIQVNVSFKKENQSEGWGTKRANTELQNQGRFPANFIHDGSEEVVSLFPETNPSSSGGISSGRNFGQNYEDDNKKQLPRTGHDDNGGSAARFFYVPKASTSEKDFGLEDFEKKEIRGGGGRAKDGYATDDPEQQRLKDAAVKFGAVKVKKGNIHPTVKPIELMRYLIKMITPKDGIVLDLYAGSGSTLIAAKLDKFQFVGIELEQEYVEIINARLKAHIVQYDIFDFLEKG